MTTTQELQKKSDATMEHGQNHTGRVFSPRANVYETDDAFAVVVDLPGVKQEGIEINLERGVLSIEGRAEVAIPEGYRPVYCEYAGGTYWRRFTLGEGVAREGIEASFKNGVLYLKIPKAKEAVARKIKVKAA